MHPHEKSHGCRKIRNLKFAIDKSSARPHPTAVSASESGASHRRKQQIHTEVCMWLLFAILSSVFAALTSILAKVGIDGVNSNLATAIRTAVVLVMSWGMVFLTHSQSGISAIGRKSWLFLILSGLATGASWLCYYRALQIGSVSKVVPIDKMSVVITLVLSFVFLHESFTVKSLIGCILLGAGALLMAL